MAVDYDAPSAPAEETARGCGSCGLLYGGASAWVVSRPWLDCGHVGLLVDCGKGLATTTGIGKYAGSVVDNLYGSALLGQAIALLRAIVKPAIVVVWAIGAPCPHCRARDPAEGRKATPPVGTIAPEASASGRTTSTTH